MHVRHVVRQFHPVVGGLENTVGDLILALRRQGVEGSVVTLNRSFQALEREMAPSADFHGIPVQRIPFSGSTRYPIAPAVLGAVRGADLIHVHGIDFFFDFMAITRKVHRKKLFASTHGGFFHTGFAHRAKLIYFETVTRLSARAYEKVIGSSENDANTFRRIAPRNTITIENGVDVEKWSCRASPVPTNTILALGRFSSNKALPDLISLVATLGAPWRLIIAGQESDMRASDLLAVAAARGVQDEVEVHVGPDSQSVERLIARSSYLASASRFEGFGLTAVEGLSAGLIPILNDIPTFRKIVQEAGIGLIVRMNDATATADKIKNFHSCDHAQFTMRRQLAVESSSSYSWSKVAAHFATEYERVCF